MHYLDDFLTRKSREYQVCKGIIDYIGAENIVQFMPMSRLSGGYIYDYINPDIRFKVAAGSAVLLDEDSLLWKSAHFKSGYGLVQAPKTENEVGNSGQALDNTTTKLCQRISHIAASLGFCTLSLKLVGSLPSATLKVGIYTETSGAPGALVPNGETETLACSTLSTSAYEMKDFRWATAPKVQFNQNYYLVLEYANSTGVDASNYVLWEYDATSNAYGQKRGMYSDGAWTAIDGQNHKFAVYGNELAMTDDYSFVVVTKLTTSSLTVHKHVIHNRSNSGVGNHGFIMRYDVLGAITIGANSTNEWCSVAIYKYPINEYVVLGMTFEKAGTTEKVISYFNGSIAASASGTAGAGPIPVAQPMTIGCRNQQGTLGERMVGLIDFVMRTKTKMTAAQMAKVNALLRTV